MTPKPEITCPIHWSDVPNSGVNKNIVATPEERRKLADALGVINLSRIVADFKVTRWHKNGLKIVAEIIADVDQSCVVSLETVSSCLNEQAEWYFKPEPRAQKGADDEVVLLIDPLGEDPADPLIDGMVDLGDLLAEHLCLMIDPFIRTPAVEFDDLYNYAQKTSVVEIANASPFAVLKQVGKNDNN